MENEEYVVENVDSHDAISYLHHLVNQPVHYGWKSPDMEIYGFGFGEEFSVEIDGTTQIKCKYMLHVLCRFKVIWRNGQKRIDRYYEDTPSETFHTEVKKLIGMRVKRVGLSDKNDLWLDLGDCWIVFATDEDNKESWRFFTPRPEDPHLVATDSCLEFVY